MAAQHLVMNVGSRVCALPLAHVVETMRPLPVEPVSGLAAGVLGLAIIRGSPTPVVSASVLLGIGERDPVRFVTLHVGGRRVALAVDGVTGVASLETATLAAAPPLLAAQDVVQAIASLDEQLVVVLRAAKLLPHDVGQDGDAVLA